MRIENKFPELRRESVGALRVDPKRGHVLACSHRFCTRDCLHERAGHRGAGAG
jgi:hypothetical protein